MRVLVVHNDYSSRVPSGENLAVRDEVAWLRAAGVEVHLHTASNDDVVDASRITKARQAAESVWSISSRQAMRRALDEAQPDLVHMHNAFPLITASAPALAIRRDVPVVWTVHNHRIVCVKGTHFRAGDECHLCTRSWRLPGIQHACYGDSRVASALVTAASSAFGRQARRGHTTVAISGAVRDWLVGSAGFDPARVHVKYNGVAPPSADSTMAATSRVFLYAGQLAEHKGVGLLLDAWRRAELPDAVELRVLGDGPLADVVRRAAQADTRISWLGQLPADEVAKQMADARAIVVPSIWQETFGRVAAEAMATARPVITSGTGGLAEVVDEHSGWITGTDPVVLAQTLTDVAQDDAEIARRAVAARRRYERLFSPSATTGALLDIYEAALGHRE